MCPCGAIKRQIVLIMVIIGKDKCITMKREDRKKKIMNQSFKKKQQFCFLASGDKSISDNS